MERKLKIGEKVKFLNDVGGGVVLGFQDDGMALVERDDGFEVICPVSEIIPDGRLNDYDRIIRSVTKPGSETDRSGLEKAGKMETTDRETKEKRAGIQQNMMPGGNQVKKQAPKPLQPDHKMAEVDLHIDHLIDDPKHYTSGELIEMQLARFELALQGAIRSGQKRIVFIHGAGSGMLKLRLRKVLDEMYPRLRYQDASFKEYGYGATLVILKSG